jgi:starch synthase
LLAMIARLDPQKGIDLVLRLIGPLAERGVQVVITGNGAPGWRGLIVQIAASAPGTLVYRPFVREEETLYYGGADIVLVPSRYEPCGLVQLKTLRYGAVPIVQRVGGLADTVIEQGPRCIRGTGFVFEVDEPRHLLMAIDRALDVYGRPAAWRALQRRGMATEVGWEAPAARYVQAYRTAMALRERAGTASQRAGP